MSEDRIAEIRARHEQVPSGNLSIEAISLAHADRATLLAEVDRQRAEIERMREALRWYADQRNYFPVEHRRPGDPDPAVVFVDEPAIMTDWGRRARKALEGKP